MKKGHIHLAPTPSDIDVPPWLSVEEEGPPDDGYLLKNAVGKHRQTDTGNAKILAELAGCDLRYCPTAKGDSWMVWSGTNWVPDDLKRTHLLAKMVAKVRWIESEQAWEDWRAAKDGIATDADPKELEKAAKKADAWAARSEMSIGVRGTVDMALSEPDMGVLADKWDADPWLFNAQNAAVNLVDGVGRPHRREDYATKVGGAARVFGADCPKWKAFLDSVFDGKKDIISYVQRWCGYCLTGSTKEHIMLILWGGGSNGKSTFVETIRHVMGSYAVMTRAETLMAKQNQGIPNDIAALASARLVTASETDRGKHLAEGTVKEITGGDTVTARFLNKEFFSFKPMFKLMLTTNNKPTIRGTDNGIWRRIHLLPFTVRFEGDAKDPMLGDKLKEEAAGILEWMIEGCEKWQLHGLLPPEAVTAATETYKKEQDTLAEFIETCCELKTGDGDTKADVYKAYVKWAEDAGEHPMKQRTLTTALEERGWLESKNRAEGRRWDRWKLKIGALPVAQAKPDYRRPYYNN
jgi:putative DNA primase/helicase